MENFEILGLIGKGNFGSISKVKRKSDNKLLVWKELDYGKMTEKEKQHIVAEVNILRELKHPNIVRYYDRIIDKKNTKIYIVMEYCEGGDIGALIKRCKKQSEYIAEDVIWKIFTQIVLALHECHTRKEGKILHRDLKPSNVFLDRENNVKLGDFGLSRVLSTESSFAYSHVGTPYYMSPEQIDEAKYNEKSDIWSLGCFLYELTTFNPPFEATNHLSLAIKIKNGKVDRINSRYSEELSRVINWMLLVNQDKRPCVEDLLNLPQVSLRLRERRLKETMQKLKKIEDNLKNKENELFEKENELNEKEKKLNEREILLNKKEAEFQIKEINKLKYNKEKGSHKNDNTNESYSKKEKKNSDDSCNYPLQNMINHKSNNKEFETIANSIHSQINQTSVNLNYLNLLNNKDNININYNINNKIKFENNYEMFSERVKSNALHNNSNFNKQDEKSIPYIDISKEKENFVQYKMNENIPNYNTNKSYSNYEYLNNIRHWNSSVNIIERERDIGNFLKYSDNYLNHQEISTTPFEGKILPQSPEVDETPNERPVIKDTDYITNKDSDKNFNFDPSLYKEQINTKYIRDNFVSTPNSRESKKFTNLAAIQTPGDNRENLSQKFQNYSKQQHRMILTNSPIVNNTKSFLSKNNLKHISLVDNTGVSTVTSTPQVSNRLNKNTMSVTKSSLVSNNINSNINKYSSILTRDRSFSPSAASSNYTKKNFKPPLANFNNK